MENNDLPTSKQVLSSTSDLVTSLLRWAVLDGFLSIVNVYIGAHQLGLFFNDYKTYHLIWTCISFFIAAVCLYVCLRCLIGFEQAKIRYRELLAAENQRKKDPPVPPPSQIKPA